MITYKSNGVNSQYTGGAVVIKDAANALHFFEAAGEKTIGISGPLRVAADAGTATYTVTGAGSLGNIFTWSVEGGGGLTWSISSGGVLTIPSGVAAGTNASIMLMFGDMIVAAQQIVIEAAAPAPVLERLTATYTGGTVPAGTTLSQLTGITVKAVYSDSSQVTLTASQYQLSGTLTAGQTNQVTVTGLGDYAGKTATFNVTVEQEEPVVTSATFKLYHNSYGGTLPANGVKCTSTSGSSVMAAVSFDNPLPTKPVRFTTEVGNQSVSPAGSGNRLINATFVRNGDVWNGTGTNVGTGATISVTIPDSAVVFTVDSSGKYTGLTSMDCPKSGSTSYMWGKWIGDANRDTQFEVYTFYTE